MSKNFILALRILLILFFLSITLHGYAVEIPEEVQAAVKNRTDSSHELLPPIIDAGPSMPGVYIYFIRNTSNEPGYTQENRPYMVDAHLLFVDVNHIWHDELFDRYVKDDGIPEIASVSFAGSDQNKKNREMIVLVRTPLNHYDYGGDYYDGYIYSLTGSAKKGVVFAGLQSDASAPFVSQCECSFRNGKSTNARYKDAKSIKKELEKNRMTCKPRRA